ncbi:MAG: aldehyde dehydrogenase [Acidobacteriota bacterium]|nr:aldehyde dehydrogenase [Acidobacteriota bacterium]
MNEVLLWIGGESRSAADGATVLRHTPVGGAAVTRAAAARKADAEAAVDAAAAALPAWSQMGPAERRALLWRGAEALVAKKDEFVRLMMEEIGATAAWAGFNVHFAASVLQEAAAMTTQITGQVIPSNVPENLAMCIRQPRGVCVGIAPWNAPIILGVRALAMPLACGNTVVFKASEACPAVHRLIATALAEAGLPAGVLNVLTNATQDAGEVVAALIDHPQVRHINFTGSTRVGRIVAERAARHLKPVLLELGGKAPLLVLQDADLDAAVDAAIFGGYMNQGQICMSTERILVDARVADALVTRLAARAARLTVQDPAAGPAVLGALVDPSSAERVAALLHDAVSKGAVIAAGGPGDGALMPATVVDHVTPAMRLYGEESFGPVLSVIRVADDEEAIRVANDTEYGLSAAVFSQDLARAWKVAQCLESGICHINAPTVHDEPQMPFGGVKASGYGRFGGTAAVDEFTVQRWITLQTGARHYPF